MLRSWTSGRRNERAGECPGEEAVRKVASGLSTAGSGAEGVQARAQLQAPLPSLALGHRWQCHEGGRPCAVSDLLP